MMPGGPAFAGSGAGVQLEDFTQRVPPGWRPGIQKYSFKRYLQRLNLWWRITDVQLPGAGPLMASRLQGTPFKIATTLKVTRLNGMTYTGEDALSLDAVAADAHYAGSPAEASGAHLLIQRLQQ